MGEVYKARDTRLGRDVAVKVLPASVVADADRRARFEREARAIAALSHPNILAIFDTGVHEGQLFVVTELLDGHTLRDEIDGKLPVRRAVDIATQIARGLAAAHDKGIVHRDLKPENVFLVHDGQVKILDFGLAKATPDARGETVAATDPGTVMGTAGYMAPEQVRGGAVDARTDLFALGAVLYEMLSGRGAFQRATAAETMTAVLKEDPPELSASRADLPPALEHVVRHCLERNPAERFQSARDLVFNLQSSTQLTGSGPASRVPSGRSRGHAWRERLAWLVAAALLVALIAALAVDRRAAPVAALAVTRFQLAPPDKTSWAAPLGSPDGSNGGTISPDGTTVAFLAGDASGTALLWLRPLNSFSAHPLVGTEGAAFPFWSPDSRSVGFFTLTKLKRIAAEGGPAQTLCELSSTARGASWNKSGVILFATAGTAIRRISIDRGAPTAVTTVDASNGGQQWPWFLPDGQHFLFFSANTRAIFVGSLDSPATTRVVASDSNAVFAPPGQILFIREGSLVVQGFDAARLTTTGDPIPVAERVGWSVAPWNQGAFSVSATGTLTYRLGGGNRTQFAWLDRSGRELSKLGPPGDYLGPALSRDETRLTFMRRDDQPAGDIWTLDLAGQTPSRFTFGPETEAYPVWTPDGSTIIYSSSREGIIARGFAGSAAKQLLAPPKNSLLVPSQVTPDGKSLLFFGDLGTSSGFDIFLLPMTGGATATPVVQGPLTDAEPDISPDGQWLAFATTETGNYEVFVQPLHEPGAKHPLSTGGGRQPQWRRDGRELFFVTNDRKLYAVDVRPGATYEFGAPHFLFNIPSNTISVRNSYIPSRDGQRFLVNVLLDIAVPPINVVVNWADAGQR